MASDSPPFPTERRYMSTAVRPRARSAATGPEPADVFVVFGITGDLAKVMTFHSLYRLGAARPAELPDRGRGGRRLDRRGPARARAQVHRGLRRDDRRRRLRPVRRAAVLPLRRLRRRRRPTSAWPRPIKGARSPGLLPRDPAVPVRDGHQGAGRSGADRLGAGGGREALRARRGLGARAQRAGARVPGRVPALPDRPLPREDGPGRDPLPAVREHDVRADLEPQLRRVGADHDGRETSGSRTAGTSTTRSAPSATWS